MNLIRADELQPAQRRYRSRIDRHYVILYYHHIFHAQHRKQVMKVSKRHIVRCPVWIPAFAPIDEFGIAARDPGVVAPGVERSQGHRSIGKPHIENAVLAGMGGEELAQFRDDNLRAVECCPLHARKREYFTDSKRSKQKSGTAL